MTARGGPTGIRTPNSSLQKKCVAINTISPNEGFNVATALPSPVVYEARSSPLHAVKGNVRTLLDHAMPC